MADRHERRIEQYLGLPDHESRPRRQRAGTAEAIGNAELTAGIVRWGGRTTEGSAFRMDPDGIAGGVGQIRADECQEGNRRRAE